MENIIFESSTNQLSLDEEIGCLRLQIKGYLKEDVFKGVLIGVMNHFPKFKVTKTLTDFRSFTGITPALQQWVSINYYPVLVKNGLTHGALVLNKEAFDKCNIKTVQSKDPQVFNYQVFTSLKKAEDWLKKH